MTNDCNVYALVIAGVSSSLSNIVSWLSSAHFSVMPSLHEVQHLLFAVALSVVAMHHCLVYCPAAMMAVLPCRSFCTQET